MLTPTRSRSPRSFVSPPLFGSVATGLTLASAGALSAEIMYNNTPVNLNSGPYTLEVDDAGATQLQVSFNAGSPETPDPIYPEKPEKNSPAILSAYSISEQAESGAQVTQNPMALFDVIDGSSNFVATTSSTGGAGEFYYGFQTALSWYGWLKISHTPGTGDGSATLLEYAYDNSGAPITVGATSSAIPEPGSAAALAAAVAGSAAMLRRRRGVLAAA